MLGEVKRPEYTRHRYLRPRQRPLPIRLRSGRDLPSLSQLLEGTLSAVDRETCYT